MPMDDNSKQAQNILAVLKHKYPQVAPALHYNNSLELLVATILSAQCTDSMVNKVTPGLFGKYKTAKDYAESDIDDLKELIRPTGFYNNKAKNIKNMARKLVEEYGGKVSGTLEELIKLPGVARKTANVVLSNWFKTNEGIAVDTHVTRTSRRLGLTSSSKPQQIEKDLMTLYDKDEWGDLSLRLIEHGRETCKARNPLCANCVLKDICPSAFKV